VRTITTWKIIASNNKMYLIKFETNNSIKRKGEQTKYVKQSTLLIQPFPSYMENPKAIYRLETQNPNS
jgi:hypothetical protein